MPVGKYCFDVKSVVVSTNCISYLKNAGSSARYLKKAYIFKSTQYAFIFL